MRRKGWEAGMGWDEWEGRNGKVGMGWEGWEGRDGMGRKHAI